ncbi:D-isomer specific 2-hydroxyacid dehydrogenase family protein [Corynebacterium lubricantis]|uniref:D-isomer specific 2-hydroxyacid dehydrogenase family protein n=1 Tax=Corynebacterium lubricantis TaxID=541095 RepID=UPI00035DDEB4|nr:D-isomer specific 2-hydroxyacid dehydrogenase family protein [Corynebacterium lubricantis]
MKFTFLGSPWNEVVAEVEAAGHEYVPDLDHADFLIHRGEGIEELPANIKWVQYVYSGIDRILDTIQHTSQATGVRWANASGVYGAPVAEAALALTLSVMHQHKPAIAASTFQARGELDRHTQVLADDNRTVTILGAGGIGRRLIKMLQGFNVTTLAVNRSGRDVPGATEVVTFDDVESVWERSDVVINLLPLTEDTLGLINKDVFAALPDHAIVVNVGRGPVLNTDDLVYALEHGMIAGAGLDVTDPEPLPENHRLWQLHNCMITPHTATTGSTGRKFIAPYIVENARAFEAGEEMPTEIDPWRGY